LVFNEEDDRNKAFVPWSLAPPELTRTPTPCLVSKRAIPEPEREEEISTPSRDCASTEVARTGTEMVELSTTETGTTNGEAGKAENEAKGREWGKFESEVTNNGAGRSKIESKLFNEKSRFTKDEEESLRDESERTNGKAETAESDKIGTESTIEGEARPGETEDTNEEPTIGKDADTCGRTAGDRRRKRCTRTSESGTKKGHGWEVPG
jgi:hypothetical protein